VTGTAVIGRPADETVRSGAITVGIGEFAVIARTDSQLITHALGSCVAVCIWDSQAHVAGLLHFLLPDISPHSRRRETQPAAFANTGIPLLFEAAYLKGLHKARAQVYLVGGAEVAGLGLGHRQIGKRNISAARRLLWANGVLIAGEETGGVIPRSVYLCGNTGRLRVRAGQDQLVFEG
jgi:chemotaxis protein CheD